MTGSREQEQGIRIGQANAVAQVVEKRVNGQKGALESQNKYILKYRSEVETWPKNKVSICLLYTSPSPRDKQKSRMPSSA